MRLQIAKATGLTVLAATLGVTVWATVPDAGAADRPAAAARSGVNKSGFDAKTRAQDDLFRHVNGTWLAEAKIPAEYGYFGSFMQLRDQALTDLRAIIEARPDTTITTSGAEARKIGDLYTGFMDEKAIEVLGLKPIQQELTRIDAIQDKAGFLRTVGELQRQGVAGLFRLFVAPDAKQSDREIVYLSQGGITLPDESYYRDPKFKPIRDAFVKHVERIFTLAGRPEPAAAAKQVMELETRLAKDHWDRVKSRNLTLAYNKKDRAALDALTPGFDWSIYFDATKAVDLREVIVRQPEYFAAHGPVVWRGTARAVEDLAGLAGDPRCGPLPQQGDGGRELRIPAEAERCHRAPSALEARCYAGRGLRWARRPASSMSPAISLPRRRLACSSSCRT